MKTKRAFSFQHILFIIAFFISVSSFGKDFYWINNSGSWDDQSHWALTSGGSTSSELPGVNDNVIFDDNSFSDYFPQILITSDVSIKSIQFNSQYYPLLKGTDNSITVSQGIQAANKFYIQLKGDAAIVFSNPTSDFAYINTFGVELNSDVHLEGKWQLSNHLITGPENQTHVLSGTFHTNGYTLFADHIIANTSPVNVDFTGSVIYGYSHIDLSTAVNIGENVSFITNEGELIGVDKPDFDGSSLQKTIFACPAPAAPLVIDWSVTTNYNGEDITCTDSCDGELTVIANGTPGAL